MLATAASPARADEACDQALADGQKLKDKQELIAAQRELLKCAQAGCGEAMVSVCLPILEGVEKAIPSLIVVATQSGKDLFDATVSVDGHELSTSLDGRALSIDPGRRKIRVVPKDPALAPIEREILVIEGEQRRKLALDFPSAPSKCVGANCAAPPSEATSSGPRPAIVAGAVIGSAALACWGAFAGFAGYGLTKENDDLVPGGSSQQDVDDVKELYVIADGFLAAASVLSAASLTAFIVGATDGADTTPAKAGALRLEIGPLYAGAMISF